MALIFWPAECPREPPRLVKTRTHPLFLSPPFPSSHPSLLLHVRYSSVFLLAELCRLSLRAWKPTFSLWSASANIRISHIFFLTLFLRSLSSLSLSAAASSSLTSSSSLLCQPRQDRVGQRHPLANITSTSTHPPPTPTPSPWPVSLPPMSGYNSLSPPSRSSLSGGYLPFSLWLSEPAECRCVGLRD